MPVTVVAQLDPSYQSGLTLSVAFAIAGVPAGTVTGVTEASAGSGDYPATFAAAGGKSYTFRFLNGSTVVATGGFDTNATGNDAAAALGGLTVVNGNVLSDQRAINGVGVVPLDLTQCPPIPMNAAKTAVLSVAPDGSALARPGDAMALSAGAITAATIVAGALNGKGNWLLSGGDVNVAKWAGYTVTQLPSGFLSTQFGAIVGDASAAGQATILSAVNAVTTNTARSAPRVPDFMARPATGSVAYTSDLYLYNLQGQLEDAAGGVTVHARNAAGTSLDAGLSATAMTRLGVGQYRMTYTVASTDTAQAVYFDFTWTVGAAAMKDGAATQVQDAENYAALVAIQNQGATLLNRVTAPVALASQLPANFSTLVLTSGQTVGTSNYAGGGSVIVAGYAAGQSPSTLVTAGTIGGVTVTTNNDKSGYGLSTAERTATGSAVFATPLANAQAAGTFGGYINNVKVGADYVHAALDTSNVTGPPIPAEIVLIESDTPTAFFNGNPGGWAKPGDAMKLAAGSITATTIAAGALNGKGDWLTTTGATVNLQALTNTITNGFAGVPTAQQNASATLSSVERTDGLLDQTHTAAVTAANGTGQSGPSRVTGEQSEISGL